MTRLSAIGSLAAALMAITADGRAFLSFPMSRPLSRSSAAYEYKLEMAGTEDCPGCMNSGGPERVKARAMSHTNGGVLSTYGGGEWPMLTLYELGMMADNGNYLEPDEVAVRRGVCGDPNENAEDGTNTYSTAQTEWAVMGKAAEGQVLDIQVVINEYQMGHMEFFICHPDDLRNGIDGPPSQDCFSANPLTRAEGDSTHSPIDPAFPGRTYVDPPCRAYETDQTSMPDIAGEEGYVMHTSYQLPKGLSCEHCVLQMIYYTGSTCIHPGYDNFDPPSWNSECAPTTKDWLNNEGWMCGMEGSYPEEIWGCSDIEIVADGTPDAPTDAPASTPSAAPTSAPTDAAISTFAPTPAPTEDPYPCD